MKEKDAAEDFISQLSKSSPDNHLEVFKWFSQVSPQQINHQSYPHLFKALIPFCSPDPKSNEVCKAALKCGLQLILSDTEESLSSPVSAVLAFLQSCRKILLNEISKQSKDNTISKTCLEILVAAESRTLLKVFSGRGGSCDFVDIVSFYMKLQDLKILALQLCERCLSVSSSEALSEKASKLLEILYPTIFDEEQRARIIALKAIQKIDPTTRPTPTTWNQMKQMTVDNYIQRLTKMVENTENDWPLIWKFIVNLFGGELLTSSQIINKILGVIEVAYKHRDLDWTRVQAFQCWKTLIDNFKNGLSTKKRMDLILIPLRAGNHRTEKLASAKLDTYAHLFNTLMKISLKHHDVVINFITFSFGSAGQSDAYPPVKSYPALHEECARTFEMMLNYCKDRELFSKVYEAVIRGTGESILMKIPDTSFITRIWSTLLATVNSCEGMTQYKNQVSKLFEVLKWLTQQSTESRKFELGALIVSPLLYYMVIGTFSLKTSIFTNATIYSGSSDVLEGTPALQIVEWLLERSVLLGINDKSKYLELILEIIKVGRGRPAGFLNFIQSFLKKLQAAANKTVIFIADVNHVRITEILTEVWARLAEQVIAFLREDGDINQGNAFEHDFHSVYSVLMYPAQHLHPYPGCIGVCSSLWCNVYEESCKQAALVTTADSNDFCEQVCNSLSEIITNTSPPKQIAAVYRFIWCVLKVESGDGKKKHKKRWSHSQKFVSDLLGKLMKKFDVDKEEIFIEATACVGKCLSTSPVLLEVLKNVCKAFCVLLKKNFITEEPVNKVQEVFKDLMETAKYMVKHEKQLKTILKPVISAGEVHPSETIQHSTLKLKAVLEGRIDSDDGQETSYLASIQSISASGNVLYPSARTSPFKQSPAKSFKSPKVESPKAKSPKAHFVPPSAPSGYVRIETPPRKIVLTDHQREVLKDRPRNIPALYQDLSQDTQSLSSSQDVIILPQTPSRLSRTLIPDVEEHAVIDIDDVCKEVITLPATEDDAEMDVDSSVQVCTPEKPRMPSSESISYQSLGECRKISCPQSFTPPSGFSVSTDGDSSKKKNATQSPDKVKENNVDPLKGKLQVESNGDSRVQSPHRRKASVPVKKDLTITRSSILNQKTKTRSGRILNRLSLADTKPPKKSSRKSLPIGCEGIRIKSFCDDIAESEGSTDRVSVSTDSSHSKNRKKRKQQKESTLALNNSVTSNTSSESVSSVCNNTLDSNKTSEKVGDDVGKSMETVESTETAVKPNHINVDSQALSKNSSSLDSIMAEKNAQKPRHKSIGGKTLFRSFSNSSLDQIKKVNGRNPSHKSEKGISLRRSSSNSNLDSVRGNVLSLKSKVCLTNAEVSDSQDIIESSQEPSVITKPCAVSLEPFKNPQPNGKVELSNVVLVKGPNDESPFKVFPCGKQSENVTKKVLAADSPEGQPSPSNAILLKVSETGTPLHNSVGNECSEFAHKEQKSPEKSNAVCSPTQSAAGECQLPNIEHLGFTNTPKETSHRLARRLDMGGEESSPPRCKESPMNFRKTMFEKKSSPVGKGNRVLIRRSVPVRSQAFLKPISETEGVDSPPKGSTELRSASPVSSKKVLKPNSDSNTNSSPIMKRPGRAAQLLGLGQAAAARGGEQVLTGASLFTRSERTEDREAMSSTTNVTNGCSAPIGNGNVLGSPSVRRKGNFFSKSDMESPKSTPCQVLMDEGVQEDWTPKVPLSATPNSILKRRRDADNESHSPTTKRKCVSFRDPPLSQLLTFNDDSQSHGTLTSAPMHVGEEETPVKFIESLHENNPLKTGVEPKEKSGVNTLPVSGALQKKLSPSKNLKDYESSQTHQNSEEEPELQILEILPISKSRDINDEDENALFLESSRRSKRTSDQLNCSDFIIENTKKTRSTSPVMVSSPPKRKESVSPPRSPSKRNLDQSNFPDLDVEVAKNTRSQSPVKGGSPPKRKEAAQKEGTPPRSLRNNMSPQKTNDTANQNHHLSRVISRSPEGDEKSNRNKDLSMSQAEKDDDTQGMLEDLHHAPSSNPVFPSFVKCDHPIDEIVSELTTTSWCKALLQELINNKIKTVGSLAALSEEKINRLSFRSPKVETVKQVLEKFQQQHDEKPSFYIGTCGYSEFRISASSNKTDALEALLSGFSADDVLKVILKQHEELSVTDIFNKLIKHKKEKGVQIVITKSEAGSILDSLGTALVGSAMSDRESILNSIPPDRIAETYISQIDKIKAKELLKQVSKILAKVNPETLKKVIFPSDSTKQPLINMKELWDFMLKNENLKALPQHQMDVIENFVLNTVNSDKLAKHCQDAITSETLSRDNESFTNLLQSLISKLDSKTLLRLVCEAGLKFC